jgi:radical SAM superfamily enzyme YgiQ (UPF0313 family)
MIREQEPPYHIPFGIAQIASVADSLGVKVAVLDMNASRVGLDAFRQEVRMDDWDVIGISGLSSQYKYIKQLIPIMKQEKPDALIVGGGGGFSAQPKEMLKWLPLDVVCIGEGENTFAELLDVVYSRRFDEVRGLAYKNEKGEITFTEPRPLIGMPNSGIYESLDDLPYPAYDLLPMEVYLQNSRIPLTPETLRPDLRRLSITHERSCPFNCRFCFHCAMSARDLQRIYGKEFKGWPVVRKPSATYYVNHIKYLRLKYLINFCSILDENMLSDKKFCLEFADLMEKEGLVGLVKFGILGHPTSANPEVIMRLRDVGLSYISFGAESANQKILDALNKQSSPEQIQNAIDVCIRCEVYPITTWMICPEDTPETVLETVHFWKRNQITCKPFFETAYPATPLFEKFKDKIIEQYLTEEEKKNPTEEVKERALERFVLELGDAVDVTHNLSPIWNDAELYGIQQLMFLKDERRIQKLAEKKSAEAS